MATTEEVMARAVTKAEMNAAVEQILGDIHELDTRLSGRLDKVEERLGRVEQRLDDVEEGLIGVANRLDNVVGILGDMVKTFEHVPKLYELHLKERHGVDPEVES